jgi:hypothetical protein
LKCTITAAPCEVLFAPRIDLKRPPRLTIALQLPRFIGSPAMADHCLSAHAYERFIPMPRLRLAEPDWDVDRVSIPISIDSEQVLDYVKRPPKARRPVLYDKSLLKSYRPGQTWYLSASLRHELRNIGDTGQSESPCGTYGREILNRLLIDLSWASSNLEGNSYTWFDTRCLVEHGFAAEGKSVIETKMILNHKRAIEMLVGDSSVLRFDRATVLTLHGVLSDELLQDCNDEGRLRRFIVGIGGSVYQPLTIPAEIEEMFEILLDKACQIPDPFEQSFFVMVHMPYLQPFVDVNKRTSRLLANLPLIQANLCPLTFVGVPEEAYIRATFGVYEMSRIELLRDVYVWAYRQSAERYLTIRRDFIEPDRLAIVHEKLINEIVHEVVVRLDANPFDRVRMRVSGRVQESDRASVESLIIRRLKCLHEGMLYRFKLTHEQLSKWRARQRFL